MVPAVLTELSILVCLDQAQESGIRLLQDLLDRLALDPLGPSSETGSFSNRDVVVLEKAEKDPGVQRLQIGSELGTGRRSGEGDESRSRGFTFLDRLKGMVNYRAGR